MTTGWFPGHMARAQRYITENLSRVHLILELVDARLPRSSRHPYMSRSWGQKSHLILMTRSDLADHALTSRWECWYRQKDTACVSVDLTRGSPRALWSRVREHLPRRLMDRFAHQKSVRAMVMGLPNVGKSTLINALSGRGGAPAGRQPGVTRGERWVRVGPGMRLLDLPGILPPDRVRHDEDWYRLAAAGLIPPQACDQVEASLWLLEYLSTHYLPALTRRYGIEDPVPPLRLLEQVGRRMGCLGPGGQVDIERAASALMGDCHEGRLGGITLEMPGDGGT